MSERFQEMRRQYEENKRQRESLKREHPAFYEWLQATFARYDPIRLLADGAPDDEYEPEVGTILPRFLELQGAGETSLREIRRVIHEEFTRWFGAKTTGSEERYSEVAAEVFAAMKAGIYGEARNAE